QAPYCSVVGPGERILLFRHQQQQGLQRLAQSDELQNGDLIEVIIAESAGVTEMKVRPHSLAVHSYRSPTFCHHCGEMLWGLVRQGLRCEGCGLDFHKRCAFMLPNDCSHTKRHIAASLSLFPPRRPRAPSLSSQTGGSLEEPNSRPASWAEPPMWLGVGYGDVVKTKVPHTFHIHSYTKPTVCQYCHRLLKGLFRQGLQCTDCRFNCHRRCELLVPRDCPGDRRGSSEQGDRFSVQMVAWWGYATGCNVVVCCGCSPCFSSFIPLMRVVQSVHHAKRRASCVLREGWLLHHTHIDTLRKRHYWVLDWKSITLYQNEGSSKFYKIPLSEVLQVRGPTELSVAALPGNRPHSLEVVTGPVVYCVQVQKDAQAWERDLRRALMPMLCSGDGAMVQRANQGGAGGGGKAPGVGAPCMTAVCCVLQDISLVYQIITDEMLGSGQFGVVFAGTHRTSGRSVAIKVIDKRRFPSHQEGQLKNEVTILQNLSHPGVVQMEAMFETVEHIFVVMEKLHGDMLEMILSSEKGRLPERNTRFLVTQVLEALRYLHLKHIAHCDLKPENVLLASTDPFPLVKLCDFGFARIIGEKSFRRSVVGTPAYLAPEVLCSGGYNRSLDMWSVGVVAYVSLSGTFPFNEDEDIGQQITNASFMYPRQPWATISLEAVSLISNLLQVSVRRRYSVGKALGHPWLQDFQLWCDLRAFEQRMGSRYLTHEGDEERWRRYAQERALVFPPQLCCDAGSSRPV
uniref:protein kinase C n=1 Tax=Gadus morhua TaxID=8049 RepID=A0A8C5BEJ7_GADMO